MTLANLRHLYDIPEDVAYLNCAYMAPQLRSVTAAGERAVAAKSSPWTIGPADFFTGVEALRQDFAGLVDGDADGVAVIPSVSYGIGTVAANISVSAGQHIVVLAEQFPSNVYPWRRLAAEVDAEVVTVADPGDGDWTAALQGAVDDRTAVVAIPNCHWTDGGLVDVLAVRAACDAVGAALVIDATQSLGAIPLSVAEVRPDVLVAAGYKWLHGPYSLGYAWFAPHLRGGAPLEESWFARAGSEDFAALVDYVDDYQAGARRYDVGEVANFVLVPMAAAGIAQIRSWGVSDIADALRSRTDQIVERAAELGLEAADRRHRAPHMVGLRLPDAVDPQAVASALAQRKVHVSVRGRSVRVSPHLWTTDSDVDALIAGLVSAVPTPVPGS